MLKLVNLELLRRNRYTKIGKGEATKINTKDFGNRLSKNFVALGRGIDRRFGEIWLLTSKFLINIESKKTFLGIFSSAFSD